jgi:hypothetical protein
MRRSFQTGAALLVLAAAAAGIMIPANGVCAQEPKEFLETVSATSC